MNIFDLLKNDASISFSFATRWTIIVTTSLAGVLWISYKGPVPVVQVSTTLEMMAPYWYMFSAFPILGMLFADLVQLYAINGIDVQVVELGFQIIFLILIANSRLVYQLPISGHALLFTYFILRRMIVKIPIHNQMWFETIFAILLYVLIAYVKVVWWKDLLTLCLGTVVAIGLLIVSSLVLKKEKSVEATVH